MLTPLPLLLQSPSDAAPTAAGVAVPQDAPTETPPKQTFNWIPLALVGAVIWFVLIGPERKNRKAREALLSNIKKGDEVMTSSGMYGEIAQIQDETVVLKVAEGTRLKFARAAIQTVVQSKGGPAADASDSAAQA